MNLKIPEDAPIKKFTMGDWLNWIISVALYFCAFLFLVMGLAAPLEIGGIFIGIAFGIVSLAIPIYNGVFEGLKDREYHRDFEEIKSYLKEMKQENINQLKELQKKITKLENTEQFCRR